MCISKVRWQNENTYILLFVDETRNTYEVDTKDKKVQYVLQQKGIKSKELGRKRIFKKLQRTVSEVSRGNHLHYFAIIVALTAPI